MFKNFFIVGLLIYIVFSLIKPPVYSAVCFVAKGGSRHVLTCSPFLLSESQKKEALNSLQYQAIDKSSIFFVELSKVPLFSSVESINQATIDRSVIHQF